MNLLPVAFRTSLTVLLINFTRYSRYDGVHAKRSSLRKKLSRQKKEIENRRMRVPVRSFIFIGLSSFRSWVRGGCGTEKTPRLLGSRPTEIRRLHFQCGATSLIRANGFVMCKRRYSCVFCSDTTFIRTGASGTCARWIATFGVY